MKRNDHTHLTLEQRKIIQAGIENRSTKAAIAQTIGKDPTTVAKEIRSHRKLKPRNTFNRPVLCENRKSCPKKSCVIPCEHHREPKCNPRDKSPGACNKCELLSKCKLDRYFYNAEIAHEEYLRDLVDFREGINLTTKERDKIADIIAPLLDQGQSVYQIKSAHPEISQSTRTLYNYIEAGVFKSAGVDNFSLKEQVNRKQRTPKLKKRKEPVNYDGRRYVDYLAFREKNPETLVVQMDTVYNNPSGPYLQTFLFENTAFMIGVLHQDKTSESMANGVNLLHGKLENGLFSKLCSVILTDRGSEFEKYRLFELDKDGVSRLNIFYCDPMQSSQKAQIENNHNYVRDIIPNRYPLDCLNQEDIDLMFSHINSTPRLSLGDKSPYEVFSFFYGEMVAERLNISRVERDDVILKPRLIYASKR